MQPRLAGFLTTSLSAITTALVVAACNPDPTTPTLPAGTAELPKPALLPSAGTWTLKAPMPTPRQALAAAVVQNSAGQYVLYAIGGRNSANPALRRVEAYNAATNTWSRKASLPAKRWWMDGAKAIEGKIYVTAGADSNRVATKALYVYNPATDTWARKADLPVADYAGIAAVIGGKLYVLTGTARRLYRYNPSSNTWQRLADAPHNHGSGAGGAIDGKFYAAWGSPTVDAYDPSTNRWRTRDTMTVAEFSFLEDENLSSVAGVVFNRKLYVIGGRIGDESDRSVLAYDPISNTWAGKASMHFDRENPAAGGVKNAAGQLQILVTGGFSNNPTEYNVGTEAYTP